MRKKNLFKRGMAAVMAVGMAFSLCACGNSDAESNKNERKNASDIAKENQGSTDEADKTEDSENIGESSVKTEYPLTITTYGSDGKEMTTTYEKAPEKVLAVYQGSIETMLALGLEDHLVATAGLDNEVPDEMKAAFSSVEYLDEFTPSLETVTMLEPDMIFSWGSLFGENN